MADSDKKDGPATAENVQTAQQAGGKTMLVRVDERNMQTTYSNAFRTHPTPEEVIIDLGLNMVTPVPEQQKQEQNVDGQIVFNVSNRCIVNYQTAKRLAITLGQVVRMHEEQHGEIKLDGKK